jgi:hypothetical protein
MFYMPGIGLCYVLMWGHVNLKCVGQTGKQIAILRHEVELLPEEALVSMLQTSTVWMRLTHIIKR